MLDEPVVNFTQSVVDDSIKKNAECQYQSGLSPKIRRISMGKCCKWCDRLVGTYDYATVRNTGNGVFRRHEHCRCTVEFITNGKKQNVHMKKWKRNKGGTIEEWEMKKIYTKSIKQEKVSYQDSFGKKIDKQIAQNKSYRQLIKTKYHQGTNIAKKAIRKYFSEDTIAETHFTGIPHFSAKENKLYLNIGYDSFDIYRGNGAQFFHEIGHYIDYNAGNISQNNEFSKLLNDDFFNYCTKPLGAVAMFQIT